MLDATGTPGDFTVMIYTEFSGSFFPHTSLGTLTGSLSPTTTGVYAYTAPVNLTLFSSTDYLIVMTSGTAVTDGAYEWNLATANSYNPSFGWRNGGPFFTSGNGSAWSFASGIYPQYGITATPVPEPSPSLLLLLGSGIFMYVSLRNQKHSTQVKNTLTNSKARAFS